MIAEQNPCLSCGLITLASETLVDRIVEFGMKVDHEHMYAPSVAGTRVCQ
jgi:hypothetical protein